MLFPYRFNHSFTVISQVTLLILGKLKVIRFSKIYWLFRPVSFVLCIWFCFQYLGNFKTGEAEFLTGKSYSREFPVIFWPVFMAITSIISMSGIVAILIKKWLSDRAHKKMIQGIHISLEDKNENQENSPVQYLIITYCVLSSRYYPVPIQYLSTYF